MKLSLAILSGTVCGMLTLAIPPSLILAACVGLAMGWLTYGNMPEEL